MMPLRNTLDGWGWMSMALHWLTALMVIGLFFWGLWMVELTYYDRWYQKAPYWHKSLGVILFVLTCWRLIWLCLNVKPMPLLTHTIKEQKLAKMTHWLLYVLLLSVMLSGYLISTADGRAIEVFNWFELPALVYGFTGQADIAGKIHLVLAILLVILALLHALAAMKHHVMDKDVTLRRITGLNKPE